MKKIKLRPISIVLHDTLIVNIDGTKEEFKVVKAYGIGKVTSIVLINTKIPNKTGEIITISIK